MLGLYISLALLGLSAIDPIGIAIMPVLLTQKDSYRRVLVFLTGSFVSLMLAGILFAKGFGGIVLRFEQGHAWFEPAIERCAGVVLLGIAIAVYIQLRKGKPSVEPSGRAHAWLQLGNWQLFLLGGLLVFVQSIVDVVFMIAMVRVGQFQLSDAMLVAAVATYTAAALILQIAVVAAFRLTPSRQRAKMLGMVHMLLLRYSNQALIVVSLALSLALFVLAGSYTPR